MNTTQTHSSAMLLPQSQTLIMPQGKRVYTCMELGLCQLRKPRCEGCTVAKHVYPLPSDALRFAPGVIQRLPSLRKSPIRLRRKALLTVSCLAILIGLLMAAGYLLRPLGLV